MKGKILQPKSATAAKTAKRISKLFMQLMIFMFVFGGQAHAQGTWTPLTNLAPDKNNGVMILMTDGTVICHTTSGGPLGYGNIFDRLTPDSSGSYIKGTWSRIAPMVRERMDFSGEVLMDGRIYAAGGEYGTDGTQAGSHGEIYDPVTNTWTECIGPNAVISDGNCKLLYNGTVLQALVNKPYPTATVIYNPATNAYTIGPSTRAGQNESIWLKLPDNSVLFVDEGLQTSERFIPSLNQWIADGNVPVSLYDPTGLECGPGFLLPDGRGFFLGATGHTAYYTPSGANSPGTWAAGPDIPNGLGMPDAPGAMMVDGKILIACSDTPTTAVEFAKPAFFYEFDYLTNTFIPLNAPAGGASINTASYQCNLLDLPDGNVLFSVDQNSASTQYYVYTPAGAPLAAGKPVINTITPLSCSTYRITGHGFNGISEGSAYGDENENDSNYPIIRLSSGGKVYYARSYNWNSTGVQRGNAPDTAYFSLPVTLPDGVHSLVVVANGIASDPVSLLDSLALLTSSLNPPAICTGTSFSYTPSTNTPGATVTWTRAAVTGISNAAIIAPQTTNPNEVLIDTTHVPITVVYSYIITGKGCSNQQNVYVTVNPPPTASFKAVPISSCSVPDSVNFTNMTTGPGTYIWYFGDGKTNTATNPGHFYTAAGSYSVKLVALGTCGFDSVIHSNYIVLNPPSAPLVTSPVTVSCGSVASLNATGPDTLEWFTQFTGGNLLGTGVNYVTPALNANATYYVGSVVPTTPSFSTPLSNSFGTGSTFTNSNYHAEIFNVNQPCTLVSVLVYSAGAGNRTIELRDSTGTVLQSKVVNISNGTSVVTLNFSLTPGTGFQLGCGNDTTITNLYRNATGAAFPYYDPTGYVTITGNDAADTVHYYFFYKWKIQGPYCISSRTPVNVVINGGPAASFTSVENGNVATFTNSSSGGTSWLWNFGDGDTSTVQNPVHTFNAIGTYTVTLTAYNSGCYDSINQTVVILTLGINSSDLTTALSIFPNPTNGLFTVSASFNTAEQIQLRVTNMIGELIYETLPVVTNNQQFILDLQHSPKGIYFVKLKTNDGFVVRKLVLD